MNLFYKMLLCMVISLSIEGREIIVITAHPKDISKINMIKRVIIEKINIPKVLITYKTKLKPCTPIRRAVVHICYANNDMKFPVFKNDIVQKSFLIFKPKQELTR